MSNPDKIKKLHERLMARGQGDKETLSRLKDLKDHTLDMLIKMTRGDDNLFD